VLVRVNSKTCGLDSKCEAFTLALGTRFDFKFDSARNLVGVHDLKSLFGSFRVLRSYESSEPEYVLLDREKTGADNSLSVKRGVKRWDHGLLFEDLVNIFSVNSGVR
jgi:hypothetical protein